LVSFDIMQINIENKKKNKYLKLNKNIANNFNHSVQHRKFIIMLSFNMIKF